ncbi:alpha/beta hydrolase [Patulibacter sp. S7RM1-6]
MPVDPPIAALLQQLNAAGPAGGLLAQGVDQARQLFGQMLAGLAMAEAPTGVEDGTALQIPSDAGPVPARVYRPGTDGPHPTLVFFHGGGFALGDVAGYDGQVKAICRALDGVVVSVDYRLAPEHAFPAAVDDALAATAWAGEHLDELGGDDRLAVGGDSAGGNLAAVVALALRGVGAGLVHQALIYPVTDAAGVGATESYRAYGEGHFLTTRDMAYFVRSYAGDHDPADPRISPLRAEDLSGLPPATVITGECDPLRDEGEAYAERLRAAGVPVELRRYAGQVHPFVLLAGIVDDAVAARQLLSARLREAFGG